MMRRKDSGRIAVVIAARPGAPILTGPGDIVNSGNYH